MLVLILKIYSLVKGMTLNGSLIYSITLSHLFVSEMENIMGQIHESKNDGIKLSEF